MRAFVGVRLYRLGSWLPEPKTWRSASQYCVVYATNEKHTHKHTNMRTQIRRSRNQSRKEMAVSVVVVDDHHHCLSAIHEVGETRLFNCCTNAGPVMPVASYFRLYSLPFLTIRILIFSSNRSSSLRRLSLPSSFVLLLSLLLLLLSLVSTNLVIAIVLSITVCCQAIRQRRLPFSHIHVLHVDAHPDLSFSTAIDTDVVFDPETLYDALDDSVAGIAEFLLPLVFAGHVSQITWVKSVWATQVRPVVTNDNGRTASIGAGLLAVT